MGQSTLSSTIRTLIIMIGLVVAISLLLTPADNFLRVKSVEICSTASRFEETKPELSADGLETGNVTRVSYPVQDIFKNCLKSAGY